MFVETALDKWRQLMSRYHQHQLPPLVQVCLLENFGHINRVIFIKHFLFPLYLISPTINTPVRLNSILFKPESSVNIENSQEDPSEYPDENTVIPNEISEEQSILRDTIRHLSNPMHQTFGGEFAYPRFEPIKHAVKNSLVCQSFVVGDPKILKRPNIPEENNPDVMK